VVAPVQAKGTRPSRALPYALSVDAQVRDGAARLTLTNTGAAAAVLHVYDRRRLETVPRRYTLAPGTSLEDAWPAGAYDLWVLGPNGFHRRFAGNDEGVEITARAEGDTLRVSAVNTGKTPRALSVEVLDGESLNVTLAPGETRSKAFPTRQGWYDITARLDGAPAWLRRVSGRIETGKDSVSDPWMGGPALLEV
jgi:phospholipase C